MKYKHYFKSRKGEMVNLLKKIASLESPSSDKSAVDKCSNYLAKEFQKYGAKTTRYPFRDIGDLFLAEYPRLKTRERKEQILVLTHVDTVWPVGKLEEMPFYISGDKVFGPGVLDMKAGLVMAISSIRAIHELNIEPQKKIAIFMNSAEEVGSEAANEMIQKLAKRSSCVLCLEPSLPGGALKNQRKGRFVIKLSARGKSSHAGHPEEGVNAIEELMVQLRTIRRIKSEAISVNIGIIKGGDRVNIVPESASAYLDIRFWNSTQRTKILDSFKLLQPKLKGAKIKYSVESFLPPLEKTQASDRLFTRVKDIASSMNIHLEAGKTGGGSDASIAANTGVATLDGLGPDGAGIHAENEHLLLSSLIERTALFTELLCQL
ncbi:MAG: M20 family metallopeptidase [Candidatus Aminicenantes bacterium]|jgi:glutamate carboxypeptidase